MLYQNNNRHGGDIYGKKIDLDFSVSMNPYGACPAAIEAVRDAATEIGKYPDPECRDLIHAIAEYEEVPESQILCGNGAAELIWSFCSAARELRDKKNGDGFKAVMTAPSFSEYELGMLRAGGRVEHYPLKKEEGFRLDAGFTDHIRKEGPDVVFLCNPNNPDGREIPQDLLEAVLELAGKADFRLFVDECFLDLSDHGKSLKDRLEEHPGLVLLKAFTKNYGLAGIRLGYCLSADPELLAHMSAGVQPWNVSVPAQAAGIAALSDRGFPQKARPIIPAERSRLSLALQELGLTVYPSEANFILLEGPEGLDIRLQEYGIAIRNCDNFCGLEPGWYRIAVRLPEENEKLIRAMRMLYKRNA